MQISSCQRAKIISEISLQAVRKMMWSPESVSTTSDIWQTPSAKEASSNGFCICPRPNGPRSPPLRAEEQSLNWPAISAKRLRRCETSLIAASSEW